MHRITAVAPDQYERLAEIWEASVRATHDFLDESDIAFLRPKVRHDYLPAVTLRACEDDRGRLLGFVGVHGEKVEMLFVAPESRGGGVGATLLRHAVERLGATSVDVNEQNPQAIGFYERMGLRAVGRSPFDGQGKPFPLVHMALAPRGRPAEEG